MAVRLDDIFVAAIEYGIEDVLVAVLQDYKLSTWQWRMLFMIVMERGMMNVAKIAYCQEEHKGDMGTCMESPLTQLLKGNPTEIDGYIQRFFEKASAEQVCFAIAVAQFPSYKSKYPYLKYLVKDRPELVPKLTAAFAKYLCASIYHFTCRDGFLQLLLSSGLVCEANTAIAAFEKALTGSTHSFKFCLVFAAASNHDSMAWLMCQKFGQCMIGTTIKVCQREMSDEAIQRCNYYGIEVIGSNDVHFNACTKVNITKELTGGKSALGVLMRRKEHIDDVMNFAFAFGKKKNCVIF